MYNINEIKKFIHEREKGRLKIYEDVLEKCFHRIQTSVLRDEQFSLFIVPDFIMGKPTYNFANCIQYVIFRLKQNGFNIKYYYPNALQIIWGKTDFNSMLNIENDRGTLNLLAIENNPKNSPTLFDMKTPHTGENLGIFSKRPTTTGKKVINLNMGTTDLQNSNANANDDNFTIHFKGETKENRKKQIQDEKFRAINTFIPKTDVFSKLI
jgi:hypothetical protein